MTANQSIVMSNQILHFVQDDNSTVILVKPGIPDQRWIATRPGLAIEALMSPILSAPDSRKYLLAGLILSLLLLLVLLAGLSTGVAPFTWGEIIAALLGQDIPNASFITELRLPRVLQAIITGGVLTLSGFYMQALIKNPLADPYIMGLTAGAGFGVNLVILGLIPVWGLTAIAYPLFAALGSILSLLLVLGLGFRAFFEDNAKLLIAGGCRSCNFYGPDRFVDLHPGR
jgi:iron complex transport system permease protein